MTSVPFVNTDERYSKDSTDSMIDKGVAAIWGYPDGGAKLERLGAQAGETIFAYQNGVGVVARGVVGDGQVYKAGESVMSTSDGTNEWHLNVDWNRLPDRVAPPTSSSVAAATGTSIAVPPRAPSLGAQIPLTGAIRGDAQSPTREVSTWSG